MKINLNKNYLIKNNKKDFVVEDTTNLSHRIRRSQVITDLAKFQSARKFYAPYLRRKKVTNSLN